MENIQIDPFVLRENRRLFNMLLFEIIFAPYVHVCMCVYKVVAEETFNI